MTPSLTTPRFVLRPLGPDDSIEPLRSWLADPEIMGPLNMPARQLSTERVREYLATFNNRDKYFLGLFLKEDGRQIGFWILEINRVHETATWHTAVGEKSHWGSAAGVEAGVALLDWLFNDLKVAKVIGTAAGTNEKVLHRYRNTGWRLEGILKSELRSLSGGPRIDQYRFGLLREEWSTVREKALAALKS